MRLPSIVAMALGALGYVGAANAHGIWIAERWGELGIVYGHGASDDPYDPSKIRSLIAVDDAGAPVAVKTKARETHAVVDAEETPSIIIIDFDNGFYTEGPDGKWVNKPKREVEGAKQAGRYLKHSVSILHLHDDLPDLPAQDLQIVPLSNPTALELGESFKIRVLYKGEPITGIAVIPDYVNQPETTLGRTDETGVAEVVVRNDGLNVVAVSHEIPLDGDLDADLVQHFATLSFVAAHDH